MKAERCQTLPGSGFSGREGAGCEPRPQGASQVEEVSAQHRGPDHGHFGAGQWLRIGGREAAGRRRKSLLSFNSLDIPPALSPQNEARGDLENAAPEGHLMCVFGPEGALSTPQGHLSGQRCCGTGTGPKRSPVSARTGIPVQLTS